MSDSLVGVRVRFRSIADTTCGPAVAGSCGVVVVGSPDRARPRGHPGRRIQVSADLTGGWADLDVDDVEVLDAGALAAEVAAAEPEPNPYDVVRAERDGYARELQAARVDLAELRAEVAALRAAAPLPDAPADAPSPEVVPSSPSPDAPADAPSPPSPDA